MVNKALRVLVVDDSALVRECLSEILLADSSIAEVSTAADPYIAAHKLSLSSYNVIVLDIEMPRMDGLTFLEKIMAQHPIPVVICSSLSGQGDELAMRALDLGAVDVLSKPKADTKNFLQNNHAQFCDAVRAAAHARVGRKRERGETETNSGDGRFQDRLTQQCATTGLKTTDRVILVGASTGGTEAIRIFLEAMPGDAPGTVIVQHMPEKFTSSFAKRLNELSAMTVKEAEHGDRVMPGRAFIAPGNRHTMIRRSGAQYYVDVRDGPLVCRHRPSVDVLFRSAARCAGSSAVGVIMTGMGRDGARGLRELREASAFTIAQNEASCVVFGMPKEAIALDAAAVVLPLERIAGAALEACSHDRRRPSTGVKRARGSSGQ